MQIEPHSIVRPPRNWKQSAKLHLQGDTSVCWSYIGYVSPRLSIRLVLSSRTDTIDDQLCQNTEPCTRTSKDHWSGSMFFSSIPAANDQEKPRSHAAFKCTLQSTQGEELCKVLAESDTQNAYAPQNHVDGESHAHLIALHDDCAWKFKAHVGNVCDFVQPSLWTYTNI